VYYEDNRLLTKAHLANNLPCPHIPYGMQIFHGIHMESMWNMFGSIWNIEWIPYGIEIFHGFHMDSIWNGNILWISHGMDSKWIPYRTQLKFKNSFKSN